MRIGDVIGVIALAIVILIGVIIGANLQTAVNAMGLTGSANTTATAVFSNFWTGMMLASIGIIVAAAVGIVALVISALGGGRGPG